MMLCSKLHCQKFFRLKLFSYKIGPWRRKAGVCMLDSMEAGVPRKALRGGISKVYLLENLSTFGHQCPQNGSKNDKMAPRTTRRCPHEGSRVVKAIRCVLSHPKGDSASWGINATSSVYINDLRSRQRRARPDAVLTVGRVGRQDGDTQTHAVHMLQACGLGSSQVMSSGWSISEGS